MWGVPEMVEPLRTNLMTRYARELFSGNGKKYRDSKTLLKIDERKTGSCITRDRKERRLT